MMQLKVVWKDSNSKTAYKPIRYRKHIISGFKGGWITDIEGDDNVYLSNYDALNAIDKYLGDYGQKGCAKRKSCGIRVIGKKGNETWEKQMI